MATPIMDINGNLVGYNGKPSKAQTTGQDSDYNAYMANKNGVLPMQQNTPIVNPMVTTLQTLFPNASQEQLDAILALQGVPASPSTTINQQVPQNAPMVDTEAIRKAWIAKYSDSPAPFVKGVLNATIQMVFEATSLHINSFKPTDAQKSAGHDTAMTLFHQDIGNYGKTLAKQTLGKLFIGESFICFVRATSRGGLQLHEALDQNTPEQYPMTLTRALELGLGSIMDLNPHPLIT